MALIKSREYHNFTQQMLHTTNSELKIDLFSARVTNVHKGVFFLKIVYLKEVISTKVNAISALTALHSKLEFVDLHVKIMRFGS